MRAHPLPRIAPAREWQEARDRLLQEKVATRLLDRLAWWRDRYVQAPSTSTCGHDKTEGR